MKILILGCGRMGLSHLLQLSSLLSDLDTEFHIIDPSIMSRAMAYFFFKQRKLKFISRSKAMKLPPGSYDFAVDASPPFEREENISLLTRLADYSLIEKPVKTGLDSSKAMSGYVLQHGPLIDKLLKEVHDACEPVDVVTAKVKTNLTFDGEGWRSGAHSAVVSEFMGHLLSVSFLLRVPQCKPVIKQVSTGKRSIIVEVSFDDWSLNCIFEFGDSSVRKTSYNWAVTQGDRSIEYDCYEIVVNKQPLENIASHAATADFYLRGFDFSKQAACLLQCKGDRMTPMALSICEELISDVEFRLS
jgi:hypothetical protein